jgi:hypothetical protein
MRHEHRVADSCDRGGLTELTLVESAGNADTLCALCFCGTGLL